MKKKKFNFNLIESVKNNTKELSRSQCIVVLFKLLVFLFIIIGLPLIMFIFYRNTFFNVKSLSHLPSTLADNKFEAFGVLILMQILQIIVCVIPGQPIQMASSYTFGFWGGLLITIIGAVLGTIITYCIAAFLGKSAMRLIFGREKINKYSKKLNNRKSYLLIFIIYLIPGIPKDSVSYIAGISEIKLRPFVYMSTLGRIPGVAGSLLIGYFSKTHNYQGMVVVVLIALITFVISIYRRKDIAAWVDSVEEKGDRMEEIEKEYRAQRKKMYLEHKRRKIEIEKEIENKNRKNK